MLKRIKALSLLFFVFIFIMFAKATVSVSAGSKIDEFIADARWKNGAYYDTRVSNSGKGQLPYLRSYTCYGCMAYTADFVKYVYNVNNPNSGRKFSSASEIQAGDVIYTPKIDDTIKQHWFVVLNRNGNTLTTAEAGGNRVYIASNHYSISGNVICDSFAKKNTKINRTIEGHHYGDIPPGNQDATPPTISNVHITDIDKNGYTVNCTVSDNNKIGKVQFPTWTINNDQDDLIWYTYSENLNVPSANISYRINRSNHNNEAGLYITHIYVYDQAGNLKQDACTAVIVDENEPPVISNIKVSNITSDGYTVYCDITDNNKIGKVQFPTWNINDSQNTLIWHTYSENVNSNTVRAAYRVKISEHNNEFGEYMTHIYAYDQSGNQTSAAINVTNIKPYYDFVPVNIFEYNKNIYAVYDNALSWTEANELCASVGGHLVSIANQIENDEITKHLSNGNHYWIGLNDAASEGNFVWSNGENVTYSNWSGANPDNAGGNENYVEIYTENGKWNDNVNESYKNVSLGQTGFILEIENSSIQLAKTEFYKNSKYEFYNTKMPYSVAKFYAERMGGHIVSINSAEENSFITARLMGTTWLALTDLESEGNFKWTTGEELIYTNWDDGEPNDDHSEDYGTIQAGGRWNDIRNQYGYYLVIEYPADIDLSGKNDKTDAEMLLRHISGIENLTNEQYSRADIDNNGKIDILDVIEILKNNKQ